MKRIRSTMMLLALVLAATLFPGRAESDVAPRPNSAPRCEAAAAAAVQPVAQGGSPCQRCPDTCSGSVRRCQGGSVKSCYDAAACLCRCNLDAGGCGSDKDALRKCIDENEKNARAMER